MIAVISDSHVPHRAEKIPERFLEIVEKSELCVHAGDLTAEKVLEDLEELTEVVAVKGNCDRFQLPNSEKFEIAGKKVGVYHGTGITPRGHHPTLASICEKMNVDILVHGHTHDQEAERHEEKILLNPGSCTGVGGGSSRGENPRMMVLRERDRLEVEMLELSEDGLKSSQEIFLL
jgi:hypothetical protein